jgi:Spy/CpxP family protein refolding chaperone
MNLHRIAVLALFAAGLARADGPEDDAPSADLREHHRHHQHGGITQFIEMSLDTLGEDEAKRPEVEKIQQALHGCMEPVEEGERKVLLSIADGVAAGAVDRAKVEAGVAELSKSGESIHDCAGTALNQLHALLSPAERASVAEKVKAHWDVWREVNHDAVPGGREKTGRLAALAKELSLSPEQVEKMAPALQAAGVDSAHTFDPNQVKAQIQAFNLAFASNAFDAKAVVTHTTSSLTTHGTMRMARFYETITPLLTPEQRTTLAAHLREHADHHPERG